MKHKLAHAEAQRTLRITCVIDSATSALCVICMQHSWAEIASVANVELQCEHATSAIDELRIHSVHSDCTFRIEADSV